MKKAIVTAVLALFSALMGLGVLAPTASATPVGFIQDLNNHGIVVYDAQTALTWGYAICDTLNDYNGAQVVVAFYQITGYEVPDYQTAWVWVESAVENLCPWHDHRRSSNLYT